MNNIQALIVGICLGAALAWLVTVMFTREKRQEEKVPNTLALKTSPADAIAFLEVLAVAGIVLDRFDNVIGSTVLAQDMGLIEYSKLTSPELKEFATRPESLKKL
ncbi:MAG: hypothetical protein EBQ79_03660 [Actinobacteria bacterium]|nr:hypothetical protein [Actinomycetota bacterium]